LYRLLYISTARAPHTATSLDQILTASRRNNTKAKVTGLLLAGGRRFLQVLEGEEWNVRQTYERIKADDRHFATVILKSGVADERAFPDWSMAYKHGGDPSEATNTVDEVAALIAPITDPTLRAYFEGFAGQTA
jgi:hypothetical protein